MRLFSILAGVALVLSAIVPVSRAAAEPAFAITGAQFFSRCTNPPAERGTAVVALCEGYVMGIADSLHIGGRVCFGPHASGSGVLPAALQWIDAHRVNAHFPASVMIQNGLLSEYPCRGNRVAAAPGQPPARFGRIEKFYAAVKKTSVAMVAP